MYLNWLDFLTGCASLCEKAKERVLLWQEKIISEKKVHPQRDRFQYALLYAKKRLDPIFFLSHEQDTMERGL